MPHMLLTKHLAPFIAQRLPPRSDVETLDAPLQGMFSYFAIAGVLLLGAPIAEAADEDLYFSSLPVVATVSRLPQPLSDAPASVTVIDSEMIRASGSRSVADLLRLVPGFQVSPSTTDAPRVSYHGLADEDFSSRVQVLVDGRSLYSPLFQGGVNWNLMPVALEDIDRIEVLRGSNAAAFGANAFLGVVNIITLDPSQAQGATASVSHGNQGVRDASARVGGRIGPGYFRLTLRQQDDNGITNRNDWIDDYRSRVVDLRAEFTVSDRDEIQLGAGHAGSRIENGRIARPCDPLRPFDQSSNFVQGTWRRTLEEMGELAVRFVHSEDWASDRHFAFCPPYRLDLDYGGRAQRDDLEMQHTVSFGSDLRLVWGLGHRYDSVRAPYWFFGNKRFARDVLRSFANLEWRPTHRWAVNLGGGWDRDSLAGTNVSPRVSVSYHLDGMQTLRLGMARSFRTASLFELRGDARAVDISSSFPPGSTYLKQFGANPLLRPERLDALEVGYLAEFRPLAMSLDVRAFHERVPNRVLVLGQFEPCAFVVGGACFRPWAVERGINAQDVHMRGVEYQWRWQVVEGTRLMVNQSFLRIGARMLDVVVDPSVPDPIKHAEASAPHRSTTLMLMQRLLWGMEFSGTYHFVDKMQWTRNTAQEVAPYRRLDLRLGWPFKLGGARGELAYTIQNANGEHAELKYDRILSERQWLTLRLEI